jgi:hypothetical protein
MFFIEKDSGRFLNTSGWGYAAFDYNAAADSAVSSAVGGPARAFL